MNDLFKRGMCIFGTIWLIIGLIAIAVGAGFAIHTQLFLSSSIAATGIVQSLVEQPGQQNMSSSYAPVFTFTAQDTQTYTITSHIASNPPGYTVGQQVKVLYQANDPSAARLDSFFQLWFVPLICSGIGVPFSLIGFFFLLAIRRAQRGEMPSAFTPKWK